MTVEAAESRTVVDAASMTAGGLAGMTGADLVSADNVVE